jgi:hypothetical protein
MKSPSAIVIWCWGFTGTREPITSSLTTHALRIAAFAFTSLVASFGCNSTASTDGDVGGACFADHTCNHGNKCLDGTCTPCAVGTLGCACADKNICGDSLACQSGICWEDNGPVPADPACYTPCLQGITDSTGTYLECSADGLMKACLDGAQCTDGSCIRPASAVVHVPPSDAGGNVGSDATVGAPTSHPPGGGVSCGGNVECPDFQVCIQGTCYSNCEYDSDCTGGKKCYRKSCRLPCTTDKPACPASTYCAALDSSNGYCMPLKDPPVDGGTKSTVEGTYDLSSDTFHFSNTHIQQVFTLTNHAPRALEFTITKVEHTEYTDTGPNRITTNSLPWVTMGEKGKAAKVNSFKVTVDGDGGTLDLEVDSSDPMAPKKWDGVLQVTSAELGNHRISMDYAAGADGRWAGKAYYFAQFGENNLEAWMANRADEMALAQVGNAFVQRWGAMRAGRISVDEFNAVLTATTTDGWEWPSVKSVCPTAACYLYTNADGFGRYSDSLADQPVPTGVSELPVALDVQVGTSALELTGRIVSSESLQYAGDPGVLLEFAADPSQCSDANSSACLAFVQTLDATIIVGGRYRTDSTDTGCSKVTGYKQTKIPWLPAAPDPGGILGFVGGTSSDPATGASYAYECRDTLQPFGSADTASNESLAGSNPVPDGRSRMRGIELVDGALVNQNTLYLMFRERFDASFLGAKSAPFSAYGFMVLKRTAAQLDSTSFNGWLQLETRAQPSQLLGVANACDALKGSLTLNGLSNDDIAATMITGQLPSPSWAGLRDDDVHYFCHDTGLFDQGPDLNAPAICPVGSGVTFFYSPNVPKDLSTLDCQKTKTCQSTLDDWNPKPPASPPDPNWIVDPIWQCTPLPADGTTPPYCDSDRAHLKAGKTFYARGASTAVFTPLRAAIDDAFRYKTKFQSRQGTNVGFTPSRCVPDSNSVPYCYDPAEIEEIRERVDCLVSLYSTGTLSDPQGAFKAYLKTNFADSQDGAVTHDGFELLLSELLIMLGDDAYTAAFESRFDLADSARAAFEGSKFEPNGIDLAGGAGYEMYTLYLAAQYYQMVLDRFYSQFPFIAYVSDPAHASANGIIDEKTVVDYFQHVQRASTQKSRAWSEIGKRYESFNRPDLARAVVSRAYTSTYLESILVSRIMQQLGGALDATDLDQNRDAVNRAALSYRAALLDMRGVYADLTDNVNYFGLAPDYVPFPPLDPNGPNAFDVAFAAATQASQTARDKEDLAINQNRAFETDSASFQSELAQIKNTYDNQLADICGTFTGDDGQVYPATSAYAYLSQRTKGLGDPCGLVGNGGIHDAMIGVDEATLDLKTQQARYDELNGNIDSENARIAQVCESVIDLRQAECQSGAMVRSLQEQIQATRDDMSNAQHVVQIVQAASSLMSSCVPTISLGSADFESLNAGACAGAGGVYGVVTAAAATETKDQTAIDQAQAQVDATQNADCSYQAVHACDTERANSEKTIKDYALKFSEISLDALKAADAARKAIADVDKLHNQATRLLAEQQESQQLAINVEAAKNDPNVRIYKNDAILNADRTFYDALQAAYKATKVFEYYTSQSYAKLDDLLLVRLVSRGDRPLEAYLSDLQSAYTTFRENYGHPDTRVEIESLRDDILNIPRIGEDGAALSQTARVRRFRAALVDPDLLDAHGYLTIPFSTTLAKLSPLTRDHKILYIEAEIVGSDIGDNVGRIYLTQAGTGMVDAVDGTKTYYRFPTLTAVVNTLFNGVRTFTPDVYRNDRLRDRPFVNTHWAFVLNQRDEAANQDINLESLTDVRLYVYYTDLTAF